MGGEREWQEAWMKGSRCVCLDMWVSVWVSASVWSACSVAHRAKTYLYTPAPETLTHDICFHFLYPHIIFSSLIFYHLPYRFVITIIPRQVSLCWVMLPSPRQNAVLSGPPSEEVKWKEETDQGRCCQKRVTLFFQPLRTFRNTKEMCPWDADCSENVSFCWATFFIKSPCREPSLRMAEANLRAAAVGMGKPWGTDGWRHGLVDSHHVKSFSSSRGRQQRRS